MKESAGNHLCDRAVVRLSLSAILLITLVNGAVAQQPTWQQTATLGYGGTIRALVVHSNGDVFAGTDGNGIFRSSNGGNSWNETGLSNTVVNALHLTSNGDILAALKGRGLIRWISSSSTWDQTGLTDSTVLSIVHTPDGTLFAGTTGGGVYHSIDFGTSWTYSSVAGGSINALAADADGRVFASNYSNIFCSTDNGVTWTAVNSGLVSPSVFTITVSDNGYLFAGMNNGKVYRSIDHGDTWSTTGTGILGGSIRQLAFASNGNLLAGTTSGGVYRSTDEGNSWTQTGLGLFASEWVFSLAVTNNGVVFAGTFSGCYRSTDNGDSWTQLNAGLTNVSINTMAMNAQGHIFASTDGFGLYRSTNAGNTWTSLSVGSWVGSIAGVGVDPNGYVYAGRFGDSGIMKSTDNGNTWNATGLATNPVYAIVTNSLGHLFAGTYGQGVYRSTDHGDSWTKVSSGLTRNYIASIVVVDNTTLFAASPSGGVFRSANNGDTWASVGLVTESVNSLALMNSGVLFAGTNGGSVYKSTDNGSNWLKTSLSSTNAWVISCDSTGHVYAGNYGDGIYESNDNGVTWNQINAGLINTHVTFLLAGGGALYAGTASGVFRAHYVVPTISSFSPTSGPVGTSVTINGLNFDPTPTNNIVYFGAVKGMVTTATSTSLTVTVPAGATYAPITVTANGLTGYSNAGFVVTFQSGHFIDASSLAPAVQFTTGVHPFKVLGGDLNADGKIDLVVSSQTDNIVSIFQNISSVGSLTSSSFANRVDLATGNAPSGLAIADIDGDGKLDILVPNQNSSTVSIFRNISPGGTITSGSFAPRIDIATPMGTQDIAVGDLDGDGRPELVVANGNQISIYQNTSVVGAISFGSRVDYVTGGNPIGVGIGDLDGDGKPEIVEANYGLGLISVFRNISTPGMLSSSSFAARVDFNVGLHPWYFVIGDLDGDGKSDIAVGFQGDFSVSFTQGGFSVLRNTSTSAGISFAPNVDFKKGSAEISIAAADVDGDGKVDLIVGGGAGVTPYLNRSTPGGFTSTSFVASAGFSTGGSPQSYFAGDLDGDGKPDIVASNYYNWPAAGQTAAVLRNTIALTPPPNNSTLFDGLGSRMRVVDGGAANPNAFRISGTAMTVEAWIYPMGYPYPEHGNTIVARTLNTVYADPWISYRLWVNHAGGVSLPSFSISAGTPGSTVTVQSPDDLPSFQWTHIAGTYDGALLSIYVNGALKAQVSTSIAINSANGVGFYIGRFVTDAFSGAIDEVRLWNIARNQSDIQGSMQMQLTGNEVGLAGYWNMNSFAPATNPPTMLDQAANHNNLLVQGTVPILPFNPISPPGIPALSISPGSMDFGTVEQGSASTRALTLTNGGTGPVLGMFETTSSAADVVSGTMFFVLPGQSSNVSLGLRPLIPGAIAGAIQAQSNAPTAQITFSIASIALRRFDANNIGMWTLRDGRFATDPISAQFGSINAGFEWPKGSGKTAIFASGLWVGAMVNGAIRTAVASYASEFQPGPIFGTGGSAANPNDTTYRVYKISAGDNASTNADYATWPAAFGAPVNPDGTPKVLGDQTLFAVYNDLDPAKHNLGTPPLGAEVQQTTFGSYQSGARSNTVFLNFKITNKSSSTWQSAYVSLWSDPDLGNAGDDLVGIDLPRNLGFTYNANNNDGVYGIPPAVGYNILKGAFFTKPIQGFSYFTNGAGPQYTDPQNGHPEQAYNFMRGLWGDGTPYIDSTTMTPTTFVFPGDPVTATGWLDHAPNDKRFLFSTGPFELEPGQSKEFVAAIIMGQGTSNLNSVTALRSASDEIQTLYNNGQIFGGALVDVAVASAQNDSSNTINDIARSGSQITFTGGAGGATVESASYIEAPPGVTSITTPSVGSVGKYLDVQVEGTVQWPLQLKLYYTRNDLLQAGIVESDLQGMYYWSGLSNTWKLYSNSGSDDQGRGPSTTWVDTTNVVIDGVVYEGCVGTSAFHLTPMVIGGANKTMKDRYADAIKFVLALPDDAFKKPASVRRIGISAELTASYLLQTCGRLKDAAQRLAESVLNHLTPQGNSGQDVWVTDQAARSRLTVMVNDLIDLLSRLKPLGKADTRAAIAESISELPTEYGLAQNYPNPFNPNTTIQYQIPQAGQVSLKVYNTLGEEVATLVSGFQNPGFYQLQWNPQLPSGVYLYRLQSGAFVQTRKLILLK